MPKIWFSFLLFIPTDPPSLFGKGSALFPDILKIRYSAADFGRRREFRYSAAEKFLYVADGIRKK